MKSRFLDAAVDMTYVRDERDDAVYALELTFVDAFSRDRKHKTRANLPRSIVAWSRVSFTAISSTSVCVGIVEEVTDLMVTVLLVDGSKVVVGNRHEPEFVAGDRVTVVERLDLMDSDHHITLAVIPQSPSIEYELLCLQSVNADILDESGNLIYRMSADPLFMRGCHDAAVEA